MKQKFIHSSLINKHTSIIVHHLGMKFTLWLWVVPTTRGTSSLFGSCGRLLAFLWPSLLSSMWWFWPSGFLLLLIYISWRQFIIIIIHNVFMHNPCIGSFFWNNVHDWKKTTIISWWGVQLCSLNFLGQLLVILQNTIPMVDNQHFLVETY